MESIQRLPLAWSDEEKARARRREAHWIGRLRRDGHDLFNVQLGVDHVSDLTTGSRERKVRSRSATPARTAGQ